MKSLTTKLNNMNSTEFKFTGVDASNEISLFEYGFICTQDAKDCTEQDEYFVVYLCFESEGEQKFDTGFIRESELDSLVKGKDWMDNKDIGNFLEFVGCGDNINDWLNSTFENKFSDLLSYYGDQNIMGTTYYPLTKEDIEQNYNLD